MKQILVASDFSPSAANAMAYAVSLAKMLDMEICVIHAIHPTEGINNSTYNAIFIEDYYHTKRQALKDWVAHYDGVEITTLCSVGFLKNVIHQYVEENPVELLIMGITGSTGISGIVGSNVSVIVSKLKIPTLIVPLESRFTKNPAITLATDYDTRLSADDVKVLNNMVKAFKNKQIQVLYVEEKSAPKHLEAREHKLRDLIRHTELVFNYISGSRPIEGILGFVAKEEIDLLCLVKHHHNIVYRLFNRSTVNQVVTRTVKALLILHE